METDFNLLMNISVKR